MTLEEAIDHLQETLQDKNHAWTCEACKEEHEQLKEWLIELKRRREKESRYKNTCTCWRDYPNEAHKRANGKWKCVDCYENTGSRDGYKMKTRCIKKTEPEDDEVTEALKEIRTWQ